MRTTLVIFAGAFLTSMAMGAVDGQISEEQYRAKYGRYTPVHEARLKAAQPAKTQTEDEQAVPGCCQSLHQSDRLTGGTRAAAVNASLVEERNRVKYGRYSPAKEAQVNTAREELAMHGRKCRELGQCPLMPAAQTAATPAVAVISASDARSLAKYGRVFPVPKQQSAEAAKAELTLAATRNTEPCEHACCQHGQ